MNSILLIDDSPDVLNELSTRLRELLPVTEADIRTWAPTQGEQDPLAEFNARVDEDTVLVVTDYDLTGKGRTGLFGASVVSWCQARAIPVGDYSRALKTELPKEPNLFELRVPKDTERAAPFIAAVFRGFAWIRQELLRQSALMATKRSPAAVIAELLGKPSLESQFALYGVRLGATSAALVERIVKTAPEDVEPTEDDRRILLAYIVGHLLLNSILRFPGPILSSQELTAYVGADQSEAQNLGELFAAASYAGPFSQLNSYFWLSRVDEILRPMLDAVAPTLGHEPETHGELNREALEHSIQRKLARHTCNRCAGRNGGFWCPFTKRAVCLRADCSVGANSWVPQGARICRIERVFYDEWAPILGI
jgi:hypothetical protein